MLITPAVSLNDDSIISSLASELSVNDDMESLLERFLVSIIALAGAQAGAVRVLTDDAAHLRLVAQLGLPAHVLDAERLVARGCGMCGIAASTDVLAWVDDVRSCSRHSDQSYFGLQCTSVLAISMPHGNQVFGIYNLFFESTPHIAPEKQSTLRLIGQLLGLTLHNARIERERLRVTVMKERQDMVNEVHDALAQTLAYARMRLPLLHDAMLAHDDQSSLKYLSDVKTAMSEVHDNLREVMTYFRTRMDPLGLLHAITGIADSFLTRNGISLVVRNSVQNLNLTDEQEVQVFHIVQEALANVAKHSLARRAVVTIDKMPEQLQFLIEDDGLGMIEPSSSTISTTGKDMVASTHFGLDIMKSRAKRLGGFLEVGKNDGGGTRVRLVLPLNPISAQGCT